MKVWVAREEWVRPFYDEDYEKCVSPISGLPFQVDGESFPEITFENSPKVVEFK